MRPLCPSAATLVIGQPAEATPPAAGTPPPTVLLALRTDGPCSDERLRVMVGVAEAAEYCRYLHMAGYLTKRGGAYQMHATAFTGPHAPMIQRTRRVWDPNRNEVRWQGGEVRDDE